MRAPLRPVVGVLLLTLVTPWVIPRDVAGQARFEGDGRVVAVDGVRGTVTLDHDGIAGLMPAARTEFQAEPPDLVRRARVGELVRFSLGALEGSHGLLAVVGLTPSAPAPPPSPEPRAASIPLWVLLVTLATVLASAAGVGWVLWRVWHATQQQLRTTARAQEALRADLHEVARTLDDITEAVREKYLRELRRRLEAVQAARADTSHHDEAGGGSAAHLVVVSRQATGLVQTTELVRVFQERLGAPGLLRIIRDRRTAERRAAYQAILTERRRGQRRNPPPGTWETLGFVLVPREARSPGARPGPQADRSRLGS